MGNIEEVRAGLWAAQDTAGAARVALNEAVGELDGATSMLAEATGGTTNRLLEIARAAMEAARQKAGEVGAEVVEGSRKLDEYKGAI